MKTAAHYRIEFVRTATHEGSGNSVKTFQASERRTERGRDVFVQLGTFSAPATTANADLWKLVAKRPRGRPPVAPDRARTATIRVRVTPAQAEKFDRLMGPDWLRAKIDKARVPPG